MRLIAILALFAASLDAVPIRSQSVTSTATSVTITLDTTQTGLLTVVITSLGGGSFSGVVTQDGVQTASTTLTNPTTTQIEQWIGTNLGAVLNVKNGTLTAGTMQFFVHLVSINPLQAAILCANVGVVVPSNWWQ